MKERKKFAINERKSGILSNLIIGVLIISVGFVCVYPLNNEVSAGNIEKDVYRKGSGNGVSLMFNVYSGTDYVFDILSTLETYNAKATFFIGGCWADDNVDCLKKIKEKGHEIGNHGYFHKNHATLSKEQNVKEIGLCNEFIKKAIGVEVTLFAPPSGAYNSLVVESAKSLNMPTIMWSKDTIDWRDKNPSLVYTRATNKVEAGDLILMHPTEHTAAALDDILRYYKSCNLPLITVSENVQVGG